MCRDPFKRLHKTWETGRMGVLCYWQEWQRRGGYGRTGRIWDALYRIFPGLLITNQENRISSWSYRINSFQQICGECKELGYWKCDLIYCGLWIKSTQLLVFVNKVLLEHSHAYLFIFYDWSCSTMAELNSCNQDHLARKAENIFCLGVYKKCLLTFAMQDSDFLVY